MSREKSTSPAGNIKALTAHDSTNFSPVPRGIIVGAGSVVMVNEDDTTTTLADGVLATGVVLPLSPKRINSTGTTATVLYGVY
jgi:hypothetical protein